MSSSARAVILASTENVAASIPDDPHQGEGEYLHCCYFMFVQLRNLLCSHILSDKVLSLSYFAS